MSENIDPNAAETDVREKAAALADSIETARSIGYSVAFAGNIEGLRAIQISGTARTPAPVEPQPEPAAAPAEPASRPAARTAPAGTTTTADTVKDAVAGAVKGQ